MSPKHCTQIFWAVSQAGKSAIWQSPLLAHIPPEASFKAASGGYPQAVTLTMQAIARIGSAIEILVFPEVIVSVAAVMACTDPLLDRWRSSDVDRCRSRR